MPAHLMRASVLLLLGVASYLTTTQQQLVQLAAPTTLAAEGAWMPGHKGLWEDAAFETRIEFHMPYMNFVEDIYIHSDVPNGLMRMSYYSGANIYLVNTSGSSYQLLPIVDTVNCLYTPDLRTLENIVPDLQTFMDLGTWREVDLIDENGVYAIGYEFTLNTGAPFEHGSNETWTYYDEKTADVLAGKYVFIVNATAGGAPVNITFRGHNGFLVGSHFDEYSIVYSAFYNRGQGIDDAMFRPPRGMPCTSYANVHGPFRTGPSMMMMQSRPLAAMRDLAMAVPSSSSGVHRQTVSLSLDEHIQEARADNVSLANRRHVAMRHFRWIQAANRRGLAYSLKVNHMVSWLPHERKKLNGRMKARDVELKELLLQNVLQDSLSTQNLVAIGVQDHCGHVTGHYAAGTSLEAARRTSMKSDHPSWKFTDFQKVGEQEALPEDLDLRKKGLVTPVKDQGTCGSCWSFGTMGTVEGQYAKATGKLTVLAEQQLVDCTWSAENLGCDGGNDYKALSWLIQVNGGKFQSSSEYGPYLSQDGFCHLRKPAANSIAANIDRMDNPLKVDTFDQSRSVTGCSHVKSLVHAGTTAMSEAAQIDMLAFVLSEYGPISVSITASDDDFYYYGSGVYNDPTCSPTALDHIVVLAGYGKDKHFGLSYWSIKNSWSSHWGEDGYIRIAQKGNVCGVMSDPVIAHLG